MSVHLPMRAAVRLPSAVECPSACGCLSVCRCVRLPVCVYLSVCVRASVCVCLKCVLGCECGSCVSVVVELLSMEMIGLFVLLFQGSFALTIEAWHDNESLLMTPFADPGTNSPSFPLPLFLPLPRSAFLFLSSFPAASGGRRCPVESANQSRNVCCALSRPFTTQWTSQPGMFTRSYRRASHL